MGVPATQFGTRSDCRHPYRMHYVCIVSDPFCVPGGRDIRDHCYPIHFAQRAKSAETVRKNISLTDKGGNKELLDTSSFLLLFILSLILILIRILILILILHCKQIRFFLNSKS